MFKSSAALVLCCMAAANEKNRNTKQNHKKRLRWKTQPPPQHPLNPQRWSWRHVALSAPSIKDQSVVSSLLHHVCSCFASGSLSQRFLSPLRWTRNAPLKFVPEYPRSISGFFPPIYRTECISSRQSSRFSRVASNPSLKLPVFPGFTHL
ncbi:hypothetical protein BJY00DRAFT_75183 [Aspergillus carlsbadensis]|nr:hypothetical protein BJY00DRAFT_75183 [Aspergillus carlsbadensis]